MKRILCGVLAAVLLLSGCQHESDFDEETGREPQNSLSENSQSCTIKWCISDCGLNDEKIGKLNEALREDGCQYEVELIQMPLLYEKTYAEQVREYEESGGSLDVVSAGYEFADNRGAVYDFIQSGYFAPLENLSEYTAVPEKLWETVKVGGNIYTVPGLNYDDSGITFHFNKAYFSEEQIAGFDGDLAALGDMLAGVTKKGSFLPIYYTLNYTDFLMSLPLSSKGGLLLDNASHSAVNPFETDQFVEYAKTLNTLYRAGLFGGKIDFSVYDNQQPKEFAVMVSTVLYDESDFKDWEFNDMEIASYSLPVYLENRIIDSMGVAKNSEHKEQALDFLKRFYSDSKYVKTLFEGTRANMSIGASVTDVKENYTNAFVSDFAGFELTQKHINVELRELLISSFDRLCKSEDFDKTLAEINEALKNAGIDDYISDVNKLLEENNAPANQ